MAGKVANFTHQHMRNAEFLNPDSMFEQNMEEDEVLNHLSDKSFDKRVEILEQLRGMVRRNGGRLPFHNQRTIFRGLSMALDDGNWNVRHQCIQLIHELLPSLGDDIDECMWIVLPQLVPNLGDTKITIRRAVIQTIHVYMKYTADVQQIFKSIVKHGLENHDPKIKKEVTIALPMLFTPEYSHENFNRIAQALAKRLLDNNVGDDGESIQQHALLSLHKIKNLVGDRAFNEYLDNLSPQLKRFYYKLTDPDGVYTEQLSNQSEGATSYGTNGNNSKPIKKGSNTSGASSGLSYHSDITNDEYEFGVIPCHIMAKLNDHSNYRARGQAIEELKLILRELKDVHALEPHVLNFISFLNNLLDDNNFKITTATLEIMGILVQKLNVSVKPYLKPLVSALTKCMHDSKIVWRQVIMKVVMQLMHVLSPKPVLSVICENLAHRNSKVRQEALNIVIASLLTFPSYDFDLGVLCQTIAHTLIDPKRQVRQAALESFAVLAQAMGAGKLQPLVQAVDSVELSYDGDGVMGAVQARLARRQLPKLNADGLVDYATPIPSSAGSRGGNSVPATTLPHGADIEWILSAAGGSGSSARSDRQDMELQSVYSGSSARSTPNSVTDGPTPRHASRVLSSGKNKNRMPWNVENLAPQDQTAVESKQSSQNTSWRVNDQSKSDSPKRVHHVKHLEQTPQESGPVPSSGSYRQTYLNRMKRQQSDGVAQPFSVYNPNKEDDGFAFVSTPRTGGTDDSSVRVSFSQSWPDPKMFEDAGKPPKRFLDPISADSHAGASDWEDDRKKDVPNIPIATKPTLVRTNSSRASSKRKVPPIPVNRTSMVVDRQDPEVGFIDVPDTSREMIKDTSRDTSRDSAIDGMIDDIDEEAMAASLRRIRNSATKKVEQMFKEAKEKSRSPSPDTLEESGIFSNLSTLRSHYPEIDPQDSGMSTPKKRGHMYGDLNINRRLKRCHENMNVFERVMKKKKKSQYNMNSNNRPNLPYLDLQEVQVYGLTKTRNKSPTRLILPPLTSANESHPSTDRNGNNTKNRNDHQQQSMVSYLQFNSLPKLPWNKVQVSSNKLDNTEKFPGFTKPVLVSSKSSLKLNKSDILRKDALYQVPSQGSSKQTFSKFESLPSNGRTIHEENYISESPQNLLPCPIIQKLPSPHEESDVNGDPQDLFPCPIIRKLPPSIRKSKDFKINKTEQNLIKSSSVTYLPVLLSNDNEKYSEMPTTFRSQEIIDGSWSGTQIGESISSVRLAPSIVNKIIDARKNDLYRAIETNISNNIDQYEKENIMGGIDDTQSSSKYEDHKVNSLVLSESDNHLLERVHTVDSSKHGIPVDGTMSDCVLEQKFVNHVHNPSKHDTLSGYVKDDNHFAILCPKKKGDLPFGNKPQLARKSTNQPPKSDMKSEKSSQGSDPTFNPVGGVTFKENPNFDVAIEGKGYAEDSHFTEPKPSGPSKARDRRRVNKGGVALSPLGIANVTTFSYGGGPWYDHDDRHPDSMSLAGIGMFDNSGGNSGDPASSGSGSNGFTGARRASRTNDMHNLPRGVYGVKVRHNSDNRQSSDGESDEEEDVQVSMAQSMRESMALKQETLLKQAKEDEELAEIRAEQAKMAAEREQKAKEKRIAERQRQAENRKKAAREAREAAAARDADADSVNGGLAISGKNNSTPSIVKKPASTTGVTPKAKGKRILLEGQRRAEHGMVNGEPIAEEELEAFSDPNSALNAALKAIGSEDWNEKCDGISGFRRLTAHHSDTLQKELSAVILALTNEVKNLRSSVCRMSAICLGEMFFQLKKKMDPHVDKIVQLLLSKTGENAAKFLVADAEAALLKMADNVSPARAVVGLMVGVGHKNVLVRKAASNIMAYLVDRIGPGEVLTGKKDITDKILSSASQFIQDSAPETRWNGQKIFHILMDDPRFEQQFNKHVPENTRNNIKDKLETLRRKGLPDNPVDHSSARHRREINRTNSSSTRQNSASSGAESVVVSPMKQPRSGTVRTDERTMDDIKAMCQQMAANDWRERSSAIDKFVDMMQKHPNAVCNNITKIFDKFIPLLRDSNSKVNIQALKTLDDYLGVISPYLSTVMALTVETVSHNLSSKNKEIYDTATSVLDNMMEQIDASQLLQPFVAVCQGGTIRIKPDMIERTAFLATNVKAKMVKIHVLPLLWTLLKNPSSSAGTAQGQTDLPNALNTLVHSVHGVLGEELFQIANSTTSVTPRMQQTLRDIAEQN